MPNSKPYSNYQHHFGTLRVSHAFAPLLSRSSAPRIINVSSGAGQLDGKLQTWAPAYCIGKTAVNMLTQQLTAALPDVMVNSMCPGGWCRTALVRAGVAQKPSVAIRLHDSPPFPVIGVHLMKSLLPAISSFAVASLRSLLRSSTRFAVLAVSLHSSLAAERPNIILMMADDMGFSCISPYGGEIHTPNLQKLADEGLRFTQFYNNAKCTTTRASLLSGMYPRNSGNAIPLTIATVGEQMRAAGYRTALCGKWHLGSKAPQRPFDRGFDEFYGLMDGCCNFFNPAQPDPDAKGGKVRVFGQNDELITEFPPGYYSTDAFTDHTIQTIKRFNAESKPFFLHLAFTCPHYPLHAPPEDIAKYRGKYKAGWEAMREARYARQKELGLWDSMPALSGTDSKAYKWEGANQDWEDLRMATYAAMVDRMDQNIGRLLAALDELGIAENTIVMFLSDNGGCTEEPGGRDDTQEPGIVSTYTAVGPSWGWAQNTPFRRYKSWVNEGGISTPLIVRWPAQVKAGTKTNQIGHIIDVLPTCLEVAGAKPLAEIHGEKTLPIEGQSLAPILRGESRTAPAELCWEWSGNCAVRHGKWKLVRDTAAKPVNWELYDLEADRTEMHDLASVNPELVKELTDAYTKWAKATGRKLPGVTKGKKKGVPNIP